MCSYKSTLLEFFPQLAKIGVGRLYQEEMEFTLFLKNLLWVLKRETPEQSIVLECTKFNFHVEKLMFTLPHIIQDIRNVKIIKFPERFVEFMEMMEEIGFQDKAVMMTENLMQFMEYVPKDIPEVKNFQFLSNAQFLIKNLDEFTLFQQHYESLVRQQNTGDVS